MGGVRLLEGLVPVAGDDALDWDAVHRPVGEDDAPLFEITPDGESFIMVEALEPIPGLVVVQNWLASIE